MAGEDLARQGQAAEHGAAPASAAHELSSPQITNGTLARALIMLVWIRWPQTIAAQAEDRGPGQCPRRPDVPPQPADTSPAPVSQTESTVSRLNACQVASQG